MSSLVSIKVAIIGEEGVGKAHLINKLATDSYDITDSIKNTIVNDFIFSFKNKMYNINLTKIKWKNKSSRINPKLLKDICVFLVCTNLNESPENGSNHKETLQDIISTAKKFCPNKNAEFILVKTKSDLSDKFKSDEIIEYAESSNLEYVETSALESTGIEILKSKIVTSFLKSVSIQVQPVKDNDFVAFADYVKCFSFLLAVKGNENKKRPILDLLQRCIKTPKKLMIYYRDIIGKDKVVEENTFFSIGYECFLETGRNIEEYFRKNDEIRIYKNVNFLDEKDFENFIFFSGIANNGRTKTLFNLDVEIYKEKALSMKMINEKAKEIMKAARVEFAIFISKDIIDKFINIDRNIPSEISFEKSKTPGYVNVLFDPNENGGFPMFPTVKTGIDYKKISCEISECGKDPSNCKPLPPFLIWKMNDRREKDSSMYVGKKFEDIEKLRKEGIKVGEKLCSVSNNFIRRVYTNKEDDKVELGLGSLVIYKVNKKEDSGVPYLFRVCIKDEQPFLIETGFDSFKEKKGKKHDNVFPKKDDYKNRYFGIDKNNDGSEIILMEECPLGKDIVCLEKYKNNLIVFYDYF